MTIEEKLKKYILKKYNSIREFTIAIDLPYSTMATILKRGIANSNVNNIIKICQALEISADELAAGNIVPTQPADDQKTISVENVFENVKQQLTQCDNVMIFNRKADHDMIHRITAYLDLLLEMEKKK